MGFRNRELSEGDALLFTTMCIIGLPVDVYINDGSIYTGIFYTASLSLSLDQHYAIVLKRARMIKKGNRDANVANGSMVETLVILSEDLVQVVAKGVQLPANGYVGNVAGDDIGAVAGNVVSTECPEKEVKVTKYSKSIADRKHSSQTRCSSRTGNGVAHGFTPKKAIHSGNVLEIENGESDGVDKAKEEEAYSVLVDARQVGDGGSRGRQGDHREKSEFQRNQTQTYEIQGSSPNTDVCVTQLNAAENVDANITSTVKLNGQCYERYSSEDNLSPDAISPGVSAAVSSVVNVNPESCPTSSSTLTDMTPRKSSNSNRTTKEFKLNPGAKIFSPSFAHQRSATPPMPATTSVTYVPDNCSVVSVATPQPEVEISPYAHRSSLPVKFFPYGNLIAGNGGSDAQHSQPIVGHMGSRTQPIRYAGQYHPVQAGPTYVNPNSQNVMVGRLGPLVYVHPVSHGVAAFSQVSTCPLLTPHQVHLPKHQGSGAAQALQICGPPPFIATGQQPYSVSVPTHIPISHQALPVIRPIPFPGANAFLGSKFS